MFDERCVDAKNLEAKVFEDFLTSTDRFDLGKMNGAVDFYDQAPGGSKEVDDERTDGLLAAEFYAAELAVAQG